MRTTRVHETPGYMREGSVPFLGPRPRTNEQNGDVYAYDRQGPLPNPGEVRRRERSGPTPGGHAFHSLEVPIRGSDPSTTGGQATTPFSRIRAVREDATRENKRIRTTMASLGAAKPEHVSETNHTHRAQAQDSDRTAGGRTI